MNYEYKLMLKETGAWTKLRGNRNEQVKRYAAKYPEKYKAQQRVRYLVRRGVIIKPDKCEFPHRTSHIYLA